MVERELPQVIKAFDAGAEQERGSAPKWVSRRKVLHEAWQLGRRYSAALHREPVKAVQRLASLLPLTQQDRRLSEENQSRARALVWQRVHILCLRMGNIFHAASAALESSFETLSRTELDKSDLDEMRTALDWINENLRAEVEDSEALRALLTLAQARFALRSGAYESFEPEQVLQGWRALLQSISSLDQRAFDGLFVAVELILTYRHMMAERNQTSLILTHERELSAPALVLVDSGLEGALWELLQKNPVVVGWIRHPAG